MIAALLLALPFSLLQEPQPPAPPAPEAAPDPVDPEVSPELMDLMAEIRDLIDQVQSDFQRLGQALEETRTVADRPAEAPTTLEREMTEAVGEADVLLEDMEKLLEKLPQMESQNPQGGGGGGGSKQPQDQPQEPQENEQAQQQPQDNQEGGMTEEQDGQRPPDLLRRMMLLDMRPGMWGNLPPRLQGALENANAEDLPLRYRRWLEEYHRRSAEKQP